MKTLTTLLLAILPFMILAQEQSVDLFVGTYTHSGKSKGIHLYDFNTATGTASLKGTVAAENPSFLAVSTDRKYVYAVNENGDGNGTVSAYTYDDAAKKLALLNQRATGGDHPCHIVTDSKGTHVVVSNYSGGNVGIFPIQSDGSLGPLKQLIQYEGSGPDQSRQKAPHAHSAFFSPDEKQLYVQDLGTDKINIYDYHPENATNPLTPAAQPALAGAPGGGPRHIALSADGRFIYLLQELTAHVMVYQQRAGTWATIQEIAMNEAGFEGKNGAADIKLSPDGKFLYASNRGDANTLAIYGVDTATGKLTKIGNQSVLGSGPRNFTMSPDGRYLLVANQNTDEVVVFARSANSGLLTDTGHRIAVGSPVCLVF
ncbi:3-carboxymuconate cyclase [Parapedobacter pyrenivorans]|uniref:3-carboxymuconate cyclase n=1 Tax=Parapedobacter pyrenivorans TaxID=1305674 RepID=A0A917HLJ2_9SPHI|nr:lactonase family protein [Parapedobacter pyrenivorans]GGG83226.1 3-carboxymuconate cyclase [Parapedobacter pyrenivorans]